MLRNKYHEPIYESLHITSTSKQQILNNFINKESRWTFQTSPPPLKTNTFPLVHSSKIIQKLCTPRLASNHRSIFPDTIARSEQKWSFANSSHFFLYFPFFFFFFSIIPSMQRSTRDKPHKAERFDRGREFWQTGTPRAFHFAVIYGPPISQIRHLFGCVSRKLAIVAPSV